MTENTDFELNCVIKAKEEKSGMGKTGQPYTMYLFTVIDNLGNDVKMSTFNKEFYDSWNVGDSVKANYRKSGIYNQLVGFEEFNDEIDRNPVKPGEIKTADKVKDQSTAQSPDWDKITKGKVRSLFLQARIQRTGLTPLTVEEEKALNELVEVAMEGTKSEKFPDY